MAAAAFAGAGGGQNLCQSNYIRDKGFGMGRYVPPKAGFRAWIDVFDTRSGQRVAGTTDYTKEATAPHANATPFIQADIARVLAQLEPAAKAP